MSRQLHNCKIAFSQRALNIIKSHANRCPLRRLLVLGGHDHSFLVNYWIKMCVWMVWPPSPALTKQLKWRVWFLMPKLKCKWGIWVARAPAHFFVARSGLYMTEMRLKWERIPLWCAEWCSGARHALTSVQKGFYKGADLTKRLQCPSRHVTRTTLSTVYVNLKSNCDLYKHFNSVAYI